MREIYEDLNALHKFLSGRFNSDFNDLYEEAYNAPLNTRNKSFWEEAFEVSIFI